jgi:hypothetical protein
MKMLHVVGEMETDQSSLNAVHGVGHYVIAGGDSGIYRLWDIRKPYV